MSDKVKGWVPRTFRDSGTGETFEGGKEHDFEPGALANYIAAKKALKEKPKPEKADNTTAPVGGKTAV